MLNMDILGDIPAECLVKQVVLGSGGKILVSSYNVGDAHKVVINNVCKVIGRHTVSLDKYLVIKDSVFNGNIAVKNIVECSAALKRHLLADNIGCTLRKEPVNLFLGKIAAVAVVHHIGYLSFLLSLVKSVNSLLGAEAVIRMTRLNELQSIFLVDTHSFGLNVRANGSADIGAFVPVKSADSQGIIYLFNCALNVSFLVGILDPEDKVSAVLLGDDIGVDSCTQVADVHKARGAGCKSGAYFLRCIHL